MQVAYSFFDTFVLDRRRHIAMIYLHNSLTNIKDRVSENDRTMNERSDFEDYS